MPITYLELKNKLNALGLTLIVSTTFYSKSIKMRDEIKFKCTKHSSSLQKVTFRYFSERTGEICKYCNGSLVYFPVIEDEFINSKLVLVSKESDYRNIHGSLVFICPKHAKYEQKTTYRQFKEKEGNVCKYCKRVLMCIEDISKEFEEEGYFLLEKEYIDAKTPLRYICLKHPDKNLKMNYSNFRQGRNCPYCKGNAKYTIEEARLAFNELNLELLENDYIDVFHMMKCLCKLHPKEIQFRNLKAVLNGYGCLLCSCNTPASFEEVRSAFQVKGLELLETEYINTTTPMKYRCPKHPDKTLYKKYIDIKNGTGCPYCGNTVPYEYEVVKKEFQKRGYKLLSKHYHNNRQLLEYECPFHPHKETFITYRCLLLGHGCRYCSKTKVDFLDVKEAFSKRNYEILDESYFNSQTKIRYKCPNHPDKDLKITWNNFQNHDRGCPYCFFDSIRGEKSPLYKGGTSEINQYLRQKINDWKKDSLEKHNYRCFVTGRTGKLHVHHLTPFQSLRDQAFNETKIPKLSQVKDYTTRQLEKLEDKIIELHEKELGVPLLKDVHKDFHKKYGYKATINNLLEYKDFYIKSS